ncbi:MAG TPA: amino acid ABC transporter substrate-binding protein [Chloroflexota bacterium]|nr:amino acid ABC transporter substrate-binding protein [Chloroflexota bacterium]
MVLRGMAVASAALGGSLLAACQPAAAPAPTAAPAKPAATQAPATAATQAPAAAAGNAVTSVKVGAAVGLTGRYASGGEQIKNGYELAVKDINSSGGAMVKALGRKLPLEINILDDASDANQTAQRMETLNNSGILAYFGGFGSDLHAAAAAVAEKNKTPYVGVAFALYSIHQQGYRYLFSPFPKSPLLTKAIFDLMDTLNPKPARVAIFAEKTDWGAEMQNGWKQQAQSHSGFEVVVEEQYAPGSTDFSSMLLKAKSANPDAVLMVPTPPDGIAIVKQMKELDVNPKLFNIIRASDSGAWSTALGKDGDFTVGAPGWGADLKFAGNADMVKAYQAAYNKPPEGVVGAAYAVVQVFADALARADALDRDSLRAALASTNMTSSVIGPVTFNPDGTGNVVTIYEQWQSGKQVTVWPPDQVGGQIQYPAKPFAQR